jgi:hypothetical protein
MGESMGSKMLKAGKVVDEDSLPYKLGGRLETGAEIASGAYEIKAAITAFRSVWAWRTISRTTTSSVKSAIDPLAKTADTAVEMAAQSGPRFTRAQTFPGHTPFSPPEPGMTMNQYFLKLERQSRASSEALVNLTGELSSAAQMMGYNFKLSEEVIKNVKWAETVLKNVGK